MSVMESLDECPQCDSIGLMSAVYRTEILSTEEEVQWFREPGRPEMLHSHDDVNEYCYVYRCSLGHETRIQMTGKSCWCGWLPKEQQSVADAKSLGELGIVSTDIFGDWE